MQRRIAVIIPSLGASTLQECLAALTRQTAAPDRVVVVLSGGLSAREGFDDIEFVLEQRRLGFAAAVNRGLAELGPGYESIALLNDDALPSPVWLERLDQALAGDEALAAVQGTVLTAETPPRIDGRGIELDPFGLPIQVDRGRPPDDETRGIEPRFGVSATAVLFRAGALGAVRLPDGSVLDEAFDCYHEDVDLALRMHRLGLHSAWVPGAPCTHLGSVSGLRRPWRHPWWILANRWRALSGNLTPAAFGLAFPRLFRGDFRAVRTLTPSNPRTPVVWFFVLAALPWLKIRGWTRRSAGPRLRRLPGRTS